MSVKNRLLAALGLAAVSMIDPARCAAATVEYTAAINGVSGSSFEDLAPGWHDLTVSARVTDNELEPGLSGGLLLYSFDIRNLYGGDSVLFEEAPPNPFTTSRNWNSRSLQDGFTTVHPGTFNRDSLGTLLTSGVVSEVGSVNPPSFHDLGTAYGVNDFVDLVTGPFYWDGSPTWIEVGPNTRRAGGLDGGYTNTSGHLVYSNTPEDASRERWGTYPDRVESAFFSLGAADPFDPNPIDPNPIDPNPIDPNPIDPNPIDPNPIDPNPIDPNPIDPNPIDPNPIDPNSTTEATIHYFATINGQRVDSLQDLGPGAHELEIWTQVTGNELRGEDWNANGGLLQYVFNIEETGEAVEFSERVGGFPPRPIGEWDAQNGDPAFTSFFQGDLDQEGSALFAQTGGISPAAYSDHAVEFGADEPTKVVSGLIEWDGSPTTLTISPGPLSGHLVFGQDADGFGAAYPREAVGFSFNLGGGFVPEPSAGLLASVALAAGCLTRRSAA